MEIEILKGSILDIVAEAIVNPANSYGWMAGGVSVEIKKISRRDEIVDAWRRFDNLWKSFDNSY